VVPWWFGQCFDPQKNGGSVVFGGSVGTTRRQSAFRTIQASLP